MRHLICARRSGVRNISATHAQRIEQTIAKNVGTKNHTVSHFSILPQHMLSLLNFSLQHGTAWFALYVKLTKIDYPNKIFCSLLHIYIMCY